MAYNSSKGPQTHGDVQYEGDPSETQIDFENDFIALKTSGSQVLVVSGSRVGIGMSTPGIHPNEKNDLVIGNQTGNRGMTIASAATGMSTIRFTYATAANNGEGWIDYSNNNKKMRFGTNGLNTRVTISDAGTDIVGQLSASLGVSGAYGHFRTVQASSIVGGSPLEISASSVIITGSITLSGSGTMSASAGLFTTLTASSATISALTASAVSGGSPISIYGDTITMVGGGAGNTTITSAHLSSSLNISGSQFYGDGSKLSNTMHVLALSGDSGTQVINNGDTIKVAGGTGLTSLAAATDTVTVSLDNTSVSAGSYTYSAITVDAQGRLTAASSGATPGITTLTAAGANRVITSDGGTQVTAEAGLTYTGTKLTAAGEISASLGVTGSSVRTATTIIDTTHVSSSLNASASAFYVDTPGILEIHKSDNGHAQLRTQTAHFQIRNKANNKDIRFQLGEDAGATGVKIRNNSSAEVASIDSQGDAILRHLSASLGITGSSLHTPTTVINATHVSSSLHVSASKFFANGVEVGGGGAVTTYTNSGDNRIITSVNSNTINAEARLTFNDSTNFLFLSGNAQITNHLPTIYFSNSAGTGLGYMGYNSSNNILFQNNTSNKHIVFKANDNGTIREGFRLDGGVPEVVINQGSDSLVDFRVESDNNTHMIFSDGANDRVGINTSIPTHTLSVSGTMQVSGAFTAKTMEWTQCAFQYGATSEIFIPFEGTGESNNPDWENQFIAPFPGSLKRILVRPENTQNGNISASVWFGANTVAEIDGGVRVEDAIGANAGSYTTTTINFTGSNHFGPGDIVGVSIKPRLNPGKINLTCIWEFDKTIF